MKKISFPLTWEDRVSILAHEEDRETRFSRGKPPIRIARLGEYPSRKKNFVALLARTQDVSID